MRGLEIQSSKVRTLGLELRLLRVKGTEFKVILPLKESRRFDRDV